MREKLGKLLCKLGRHKWRPIAGTITLDWRSKWEAYEVADGACCRKDCEARDQIRRDYYW